MLPMKALLFAPEALASFFPDHFHFRVRSARAIAKTFVLPLHRLRHIEASKEGL